MSMTGKAKMSQKELDRRKQATIKSARAELVKSGIVQFRIESEGLQYLYDLADLKKMRVGAMVREWVNERIEAERQKSVRRSRSNRSELVDMQSDALTNMLLQRVVQLEHHIQILNEKIDSL